MDAKVSLTLWLTRSGVPRASVHTTRYTVLSDACMHCMARALGVAEAKAPKLPESYSTPYTLHRSGRNSGLRLVAGGCSIPACTNLVKLGKSLMRSPESSRVAKSSRARVESGWRSIAAIIQERRRDVENDWDSRPELPSSFIHRQIANRYPLTHTYFLF